MLEIRCGPRPARGRGRSRWRSGPPDGGRRRRRPGSCRPAVADRPTARPRSRAFLADVEHRGAAGAVNLLPRPGGSPATSCWSGVGDGDEAGWRAAGAALARAAPSASPTLDRARCRPDLGRPAAGAFAEGPGSRRTGTASRRAADRDAPRLRRITLAAPRRARRRRGRHGARTRARAVADGGHPRPRPDQHARACRSRRAGSPTASPAPPRGRPGVTVTVRDEAELAAGGLRRHPRRRRRLGPPAAPAGAVLAPARRPHHVVLVGKGITFDTGGISHQAASRA